jgi:tetratricopeptide (TPR) repeat protein
MNTGQNTENPKSAARSKIYLIIGIVMLAFMALVWSLDDSLVYLSFGIAAWFMFLSYWNRPRVAEAPFARPQSQTDDDSLSAVLNTIFQSKARTQARPSYENPPGRQRDVRVIVFAFIFILAIFFIIIVSVVSLSDESGDDGTSLYDMAEQFRYNNEYDSARFYYRQALLIDPENTEAMHGYGAVFLSEQNYDSAIAWYDKAIAVRPDYDDARYDKALALYYQQRFDLSRSELHGILYNNPEYVHATLLLGDNFYEQQEYDSAIYWYEQGYTGGERTAALSHVMGYIYDLKNNRKDAIEFYQEALSYDSTRTGIYTRLAELIPEESQKYNRLAEKYKTEN